MSRKYLIALAVITSTQAWAADYERQPQSRDRDTSSISDLFPSLDTLDCTPRCDGAPTCGDFKDMNSCLSDGAAADCFWSCE